MKRILLCFFIILSNFCWGQLAYRKHYGDSAAARAIQQTNDSGYIIVGAKTISPVNSFDDVYLVKIKANGDTLWARTYGGPGLEQGYFVQQTSDNGYIVAGFSNYFGSGGWDIYCIRTDASGDTLWTRTYGGISSEVPPKCIRQTADGGFVILGSTASYGAGDWDIYLIKLNANGNIVWSKTFGGMYSDFGNSILQLSDGGYAITGASGSFGTGGSAVYLMRTDSIGNLDWFKTYGDTGNEVATSFQQTFDSGFIMVGYCKASSALHGDIYLIKTDAYGDTLWTRTFSGGPLYNTDMAYAIVQTNDSGYALAGTLNSSDESIFVKLDMNGNIQWTRNILNANIDAMQQTFDGGFILAGWALPFPAKVCIIKTDSNGNALCQYGNQTVTFKSSYTEVISATPFVSSGALITEPATIMGVGCTITTLCTNVAINEIEENYLFRIFPNPTHTAFTLSLNDEMQNAELKIFDVTGKIVFEEIINNQSLIINCKFSAGLYFVRVTAAEKMYVKKLVLE